MKGLINAIKQRFHQAPVKQVLTIWCSDLDEAERLWTQVYMPHGWKIEKIVDVKWSWKHRSWLFRFKVSKRLLELKTEPK